MEVQGCGKMRWDLDEPGVGEVGGEVDGYCATVEGGGCECHFGLCCYVLLYGEMANWCYWNRMLCGWIYMFKCGGFGEGEVCR